MQPLAMIAGLITYAVFAILFGLMSLGVGFMEEPSRTIYGHIILFCPFIAAGLVVGYVARKNAVTLGLAVALLAFSAFFTLARGPILFFFSETTVLWQLALQSIYQLTLSLFGAGLGAWFSATHRIAKSRSNKSSKRTRAKPRDA